MARIDRRDHDLDPTERRSRRTSSSSVVSSSHRRRSRRRRTCPGRSGTEPAVATAETTRADSDRHGLRRRIGSSAVYVGSSSGGVVAEPAVHDLAAERGGHDQRREHDQLGDQEASVVGALERVDAADLAPRLVPAGHDQRHDRAERERRVPRAAPRAARRRRPAGAPRRTAPRDRRASTPSPATCTRSAGIASPVWMPVPA